MPGAAMPDPEYVAARRVLLDALEALGPHRRSIVLVGAQALYVRVGEGDLSVAPYTTDADLAIDPRLLDDEPALARSLNDAGFTLAVRPGTWARQQTEVQVDFLVPATLGGPGRRGARLGAHGSDVARKAAGLEAALVDHNPITVASMEGGDARCFDIPVAGVGALLIAKMHKIAERRDDPLRLQNKDGLDVLRILRATDTAQLAEILAALSADAVAGAPAQRARTFLGELFGARDAAGTLMAVRASAGIEDETAIALSCEALAQRLLRAWT